MVQSPFFFLPQSLPASQLQLRSQNIVPGSRAMGGPRRSRFIDRAAVPWVGNPRGHPPLLLTHLVESYFAFTLKATLEC